MAQSSQTLYVMEAANMIIGGAPDPQAAGSNRSTPGISTHLMLQELKLPQLEENNVDHNAGGANVGIEVPTHIAKLEATFNLAGWDPDIMSYFGRQELTHHWFTAYGLIRNRRNSEALQAIAVFEGRLGKVNPTAFSRGNLMHHEYAIKTITHYELYMQITGGGTLPMEIYHWDWFTSVCRVGGIDLNADMVRLLAIPGNPIPGATAGDAGAAAGGIG